MVILFSEVQPPQYEYLYLCGSCRRRRYSSSADVLLTDTIIYHCQLIFMTHN